MVTEAFESALIQDFFLHKNLGQTVGFTCGDKKSMLLYTDIYCIYVLSELERTLI